jgi:MerR family redox-sensitive transcriptional activator SoxR
MSFDEPSHGDAPELRASDDLTIGEVARRAGVATSALRFYEDRGLIVSYRTAGNQRRFKRQVLRRVALIRAAQAAGLSLEAIAQALASHPESSAPTAREWALMSSQWREDVDRRIGELVALRDQISSCIGCGCLSLDACGLFNAGDRAAASGTGARYLLGEQPPSP